MLSKDFQKILINEQDNEGQKVTIPETLAYELHLSLQARERYRKALHKILDGQGLDGQGLSANSLREVAACALL